MANNDVTSLQTVGKTGVGKSSLCNSILGREEFETEDSTTSVTQRCRSAFAEQQGRRVKVVDMPGLHDAELSQEDDMRRVIEKAAEAIAKTPDGLDAILIVVQFGRFSQEDKSTVHNIKKIFGEKSLKDHGIVVLTHGEKFFRRTRNGETFKQWCSRQRGCFKELIQEVNGRVVLFQNECDDEDVRRQQLEELFKMVEKVKRDHKYTPRLFELAAAERARLEVESTCITMDTEADIALLYEELVDLSNGTSARDVARLRELLERVDGQKTQIQNQDNGRGILSHVLRTLKSLETAIEETIQAVDAGIEVTRLAEERRAEVERCYKKMIDEQNCFCERLKNILIGVAIGIGMAAAVVVYNVPVFVAGVGGAATAVGVAVIQTPGAMEAVGTAVTQTYRGALNAGETAVIETRKALNAVGTAVIETSRTLRAVGTAVTQTSGTLNAVGTAVTQTSGALNAVGTAVTETSGALNAVKTAVTETSGVLNAVGTAVTETSGVLNAVGTAVTETSRALMAVGTAVNYIAPQ